MTAATLLRCPKCGTPHQPDDLMCLKCGLTFNAAPRRTTAAPAATPPAVTIRLSRTSRLLAGILVTLVFVLVLVYAFAQLDGV